MRLEILQKSLHGCDTQRRTEKSETFPLELSRSNSPHNDCTHQQHLCLGTGAKALRLNISCGLTRFTSSPGGAWLCSANVIVVFREPWKVKNKIRWSIWVYWLLWKKRKCHCGSKNSNSSYLLINSLPIYRGIVSLLRRIGHRPAFGVYRSFWKYRLYFLTHKSKC